MRVAGKVFDLVEEMRREYFPRVRLDEITEKGREVWRRLYGIIGEETRGLLYIECRGLLEDIDASNG